MLVGKRYELHEQLGKGGMGAVYRAVDRLTSQPVALKQVAADPDRLRFSSFSDTLDLRVSLAQEFKTLASLRHPHIISVLDYGFNEINGEISRLPYFTMELIEEGMSLLNAGRDEPLEGKIALVIQLLQALVYLHRRGILHRDLKPTNVLVTPGEHGQLHVKTLDFGLSVAHKDKDDIGTIAVGTLDYMAPEILRGESLSEAADLYAVGVMLYELVVGKHPFREETIAKIGVHGFIERVFYVEPDLSDMPPTLAVIIQRLLAKHPADRYQDAAQVIDDLTDVAGDVVPRETAAIRESFLQAARLVGRDSELARLMMALQSILDQAAGNAYLIAGESGVGKSRLLDEVRTLALVRGALVLRGQTVSEGGTLYGVWRPALRWLCLTMALTLEEISILKPLVPDIRQLLSWRDDLPDIIPDAPELPTKAAQERLWTTIENLLAQLTEPTVLIMEDLHWASESLDLLARIIPRVKQQPLLILGSFRDDERPNLPEKLPGMELMKLRRLSEAQILELSAAMLGAAGRQQKVVSLLSRETEGNVFFIIEILRTLAEEAGQLNRVGEITLPPQIVAGGMKQIIQRRLGRIPDEARPLLQAAAIAGRQLDLNVLRAVANLTTDALDDWLNTCSNATVLEVYEDHWRFSHDKLREGVLNELSQDERRENHRYVAEAIEQVYPDAEDKVSTLAYHWQAAGDMDKSAYYAEKAADEAIRSGVNQLAIEFLEQALNALRALPVDADVKARLIDVIIKYTRTNAHRITENGETLLEEARSMAAELQDEERAARVMGSTGAYYFMRGQMGKAFQFFSESIAAAERFGLEEILVLPYNIIGRALALNGDYAESNIMLAKGIPLAEKFQELELLAGSLAFYSIGLVIEGRVDEGLPVIQRCLELSERLGLPERHIGDLIVLGMGSIFSGHLDDALDYLTRAVELADENNMVQSVYIGSGGLGIVYTLRGNLDAAKYHLNRTIEIFEKHKSFIHIALYQAYRAEIERLEGDTQTALDRIQAMIELAQKFNQKLGLAELYRVMGRLERDRGNNEAAEDYFRHALESHRAGSRVTLAAKSVLELGEFYLGCGRREDAKAACDEALRLFEQMRLADQIELARELQRRI